jgi:hypothetical protein
MFSQAEQDFLGGVHNGPIEKRSSGIPALPTEMPEHMRLRALEARAQLLGKTFVEFRSRQANFVRETAVAVRELNAGHLF